MFLFKIILSFFIEKQNLFVRKRSKEVGYEESMVEDQNFKGFKGS